MAIKAVSGQMTEISGTHCYLAQEVGESSGYHSHSNDTWCLGTLIHFVIHCTRYRHLPKCLTPHKSTHWANHVSYFTVVFPT